MRDNNLMQMVEKLTELLDEKYRRMPDMALYAHYKSMFRYGKKADFLLR